MANSSCEKANNIGEELIKPAATRMTEILCEKEQAAKLGTVPLSARTVSKRLDELAQNIKDQLIIAIKKSVLFAIQLDESIDVGSDLQLMLYVRYRAECWIGEEMLFCMPLETTIRGLDIFSMVDKFFTSPDVDLHWTDCVAVSTDGAPAMVGIHRGFVALVKRENPKIMSTHCMIHRQALVVNAL